MTLKVGQSARKAILVGIEFAFVFIIAVLVRASYLEHDPIHDELYHLLAARSWISDGTFTIGDGIYTRGSLYTMLVGVVYSLFGESITLVRWSSVIVGSLWVLAVFIWCRYKINPATGWTVALLFCLAPGAIFLSQYIRFYSLHGLVFWLGAIGVYELVERKFRLTDRVLLSVGVVTCLGIAAHFQKTTLVGIVGLAAFVMVRKLPGILERSAADARIRRWLYVLVIGLIVVIIASIYTGLLVKLVEDYRFAPLWLSASGVLRYHWIFVSQYPLLWSAVPIAVLLAIVRNSGPLLFCSLVFCIAVALHSFAGMKAERFIYYVMPFFFVLGAFLLVELFSYIRSLLAQLLDRLPKSVHFVCVPIEIGITSLLIVFVLVGNPALRATADLLRGQDVILGEGGAKYWSRYRSDWSSAQKTLQRLVDEAEVVVATDELHMLYYAGRVDIELSASRLSELYYGPWGENHEFKIDFRTGRPVVSSARSFATIISCFRSGIVVIRQNAWRNSAAVGDETAAAIVAMTQIVESPTRWGLHVFRWSANDVDNDVECIELRNLVPDRHANK